MAIPSALLGRGTRAAQPAASTLAPGCTYCVTDESFIVEQVVAGAPNTWEPYTPTGGGTGDVTASGAMTADRVILGSGGVAVTALGSPGTTTTLLHGNAGGAPTFATVVEADITLADNTTNDVSITKHGLAPKAPNDATKYLDGTGAYTVPAGGGGGGSVATGTYASLPGTCAVGDMYVLTDSVYPFAVCETVNVWSFFLNGKRVTLPGLASTWTAVNDGGLLTADDNAGSLLLKLANNNSVNLRAYVKTDPATPYTVSYYIRSAQFFQNTQATGVGFYDGTKFMNIEFVTSTTPGTQVFRVQKWTNVTTASTTVFTEARMIGIEPFQNGCYLRLTNDGSDLFFYWSLDGITWEQIFTEAVGTFITPTHYAVIMFNGTVDAACILRTSVQDVTLT